MHVPKALFRPTYQAIKDAASGVQNGCSVLVLVSPDVDAICAARILASLFKQDNIDHKVTPVAGFLDVVKELRRELESSDQVRLQAALRARAPLTPLTRCAPTPPPPASSCGACCCSTAARE